MTEAIVAAAVAVALAAWQFGGHLAARRRRLSQELEMISKLPEASRPGFHAYIERQTASYLDWAQRPWWKRPTAYATLAVVIGIAASIAVGLLTARYREGGSKSGGLQTVTVSLVALIFGLAATAFEAFRQRRQKARQAADRSD